MAQAVNIETPAEQAAIEREIDIMLAKIEQGIADMKAARPAEDAQWARIERLGQRIRTLNTETEAMLADFRRSF